MENHVNAESLALFRQAAKHMANVQTAAAEAAKKESRSQQSWGQVSSPTPNCICKCCV